MLYTGYSIGIDDYVVISKRVVKNIGNKEFSRGPNTVIENVKNRHVKTAIKPRWWKWFYDKCKIWGKRKSI